MAIAPVRDARIYSLFLGGPMCSREGACIAVCRFPESLPMANLEVRSWAAVWGAMSRR